MNKWATRGMSKQEVRKSYGPQIDKLCRDLNKISGDIKTLTSKKDSRLLLVGGFFDFLKAKKIERLLRFQLRIQGDISDAGMPVNWKITPNGAYYWPTV